MERVPFDPKEFEIVGYFPGFNPRAPKMPIYNSPITRRENMWLLYKHEQPLWMPHSFDASLLMPDCVPDNWARGMVQSDKPTTPDMLGGKDMFGVEWEFVPQVGGSMVRPGKPFVGDLEHWEDYVTFPNIDEWDWAGSAEKLHDRLNDGRFVKVMLLTGMFERLISFVDMTDALIALVDEDQQEAVHRLFSKLADLYDAIFEKFATYSHADGVWFHDDWGSQRAPFFSISTVREMIAPYIKRVCDSAHKYGMILDLHSCDKNEALVPAMIEAGVDSWNGQFMNDKLAVARNYPNQIIVDALPEKIGMDLSDDELRQYITKFVEDYKGLGAYCTMDYSSPPHPKMYDILYEVSRKAYNPA